MEKNTKQKQQKHEEKEDEPVIVGTDDESATEDDPAAKKQAPGMSEVDREERDTEQKMWLSEKVTSLEKENGELKEELQEMKTRLTTQENVIRQVDERCARLEAAIAQIADYVQQQSVAIESSRTLMNSLVEEVSVHRDNFQKVGLVMHVHEQHMVQSGAITQEMAQYINALVKENEQKSLYIGSLIKEYQAQAEVLRQHHLGQQVIAEVVKRIIAGQTSQQPPQQQGVMGKALTVSEVNALDPDRLDFLSWQNPQSGPPNNGPFGAANQITQVPVNTVMVRTF